MSTSASSRNETEEFLEPGSFRSPFALASATVGSGSDIETAFSSSCSVTVRGSGEQAGNGSLATSSSMLHAGSHMPMPDVPSEPPIINAAVSLSGMSPFTLLSSQCPEFSGALPGAASNMLSATSKTSTASQCGAVLPPPTGPSILPSPLLAATYLSPRTSGNTTSSPYNAMFQEAERVEGKGSQDLIALNVQAAVMKALYGDGPQSGPRRTAAATLQEGLASAVGNGLTVSDHSPSPFAVMNDSLTRRTLKKDEDDKDVQALRIRQSLDPLGSPNASLIFPAARYSTSLESIRNEDSNGRVSLTSTARDSAAALLQRLLTSAQRHPKVRALVVSGGRFVNGPGNDITYQDGDVRLVALPEGGSFAELVTVLAKADRVSLLDASNNRVSASPFNRRKSTTPIKQQGTSSSKIVPPDAFDGVAGLPSDSQPLSSSKTPNYQEEKMSAAQRAALAVAAALGVSIMGSGDACRLSGSHFASGPRFCVLRYHLPSDPSVFVDVVDDDDVRLMFEEYSEYRSMAGPMAPKLKLFVQWNPPGGIGALTRSLDASAEFLRPAYSGLLGSASSLEDTSGPVSIDPAGSTPRASDLSGRGPFHSAHRSAAEAQLAILRSDQLEIVSPEDVSISELLGTGTFGDMYRARWRECDVGVKCLNPMAVGLQYGSRTAWIRFVDEANASLGALRHPNLVEVYGVVLPGGKRELELSESKHEEDASRSSKSDPRNGGAALWSEGNWAPRGERHTSWDFSASQRTFQRTKSGEVFGGYGATSAMQRVPGPLVATPALIMEYVSGRSLQRAIARKDDVVAGALARVMFALDTVRAMVYLHDKGIIHYDLKSSNILLARRNHRITAKVAAYGLTNRKVSFYSIIFN
jgi:hypothetical protein